MNLRYLRSFHSEFYETFLNFNVSVGIHVIIKTDQNFRTVKTSTRSSNHQTWQLSDVGFPLPWQADELLELEVNLPNETH